MPKTQPISPELRRQIGDDIAVGFGRNEIAKRYKVSPGLVSKIARERGLGFKDAWMVGDAVQARQIDLWAAREKREAHLEGELIALIEAGGTTRADGGETRRAKKLRYAIYNLNRHHNGRYR